MKQKSINLLTILVFCIVHYTYAQISLITNIESRETISLNGTWNYIIDPYKTGFYNYRYGERIKNDGEAYWSRPEVKNKINRIEHGYQSPYDIQVSGDWNSQKEVFEYYEGTVWYQRSFDLKDIKENERVFIHFGAINYEAHVYLNEKKIGMHKGDFTPFNFEIPKGLFKKKCNFLVVKVDNTRHKEEIPNWAKNEVIPSDLYQYTEKSSKKTRISINGKPTTIEEIDGYFSITKTWKKGEIITLDFPMEVKKVVSNSMVIENKNKIALEYGPLVYATEEIDNKIDFDAITINPSDIFEIKKDTILGSVITLESDKLKAIPYYAWSNRGVGKMKVWIPKEN